MSILYKLHVSVLSLCIQLFQHFSEIYAAGLCLGPASALTLVPAVFTVVVKELVWRGR